MRPLVCLFLVVHVNCCCWWHTQLLTRASYLASDGWFRDRARAVHHQHTPKPSWTSALTQLMLILHAELVAQQSEIFPLVSNNPSNSDVCLCVRVHRTRRRRRLVKIDHPRRATSVTRQSALHVSLSLSDALTHNLADWHSLSAKIDRGPLPIVDNFYIIVISYDMITYMLLHLLLKA